ncbi:MAG: transposase [Anaerolineales bacterium]|nr:transposase [Anaerolineales bacterium]
MTLFRQKYRIESTRLKGWDYTAAGYYFITICTKQRQHCFGRVINDDVQLSNAGQIVAQEWLQTARIRPNVELDEWVIMPNHMHSILIITHQLTQVQGTNSMKTTPEKSRLYANSVGSIIGQFKRACTTKIWGAGFTQFGWQPRFYDSILRDERALQNVRRYIANNPINWAKDQNNGAGLRM